MQSWPATLIANLFIANLFIANLFIANLLFYIVMYWMWTTSKEYYWVKCDVIENIY